MNNRMGLNVLSALLLVSSLSACGFHLRGSDGNDEPLGNVYIQIQPGSPIAPALREVITGAGGEIVKRKEFADTRLYILLERSERRVLSIDNTGRVSAYELILTVDYRVGDALKEQVINPKTGKPLAHRTIRVTREFTYDESGVLGKSEEEQILREEMRQDLVRQLLSRVKTRRR